MAIKHLRMDFQIDDDRVDPIAFQGLVAGLSGLARDAITATGQIVELEEEEGDDVLVLSGEIDVYKTSRFHIRFANGQLVDVSLLEGSMICCLLQSPVLYGADVLRAALQAHDPEAWENLDRPSGRSTATSIYSRCAKKLLGTPGELIGQSGVYGFKGARNHTKRGNGLEDLP